MKMGNVLPDRVSIYLVNDKVEFDDWKKSTANSDADHAWKGLTIFFTNVAALNKMRQWVA